MRTAARLAPLVVTGLVLAACALLVGYLIGAAGTPEELSEPKVARTFPVTLEPFVDSTSVTIAVDTRPVPELRASSPGVITHSDCRPGQTIRSGDVVWSVNGRGLLSLHLSEPPYRDLGADSSGRDVLFLQRELMRLGLGVDTSGRFDTTTLKALNQLRRRANLPRVAGLFQADIVWLAQAQLTIRSCDVPLGGEVANGTGLAQPTPQTLGLSIDNPPQSLVAGDRLLRVEDASVAMPDSKFRVTNPASIKKILSTKIARISLENQYRDPPLQGILELSTGIPVASVPASAVVVDTSTCLVDDSGRTHAVDVVSSSLGRTVVRFRDQATPERILLQPHGITCAA